MESHKTGNDVTEIITLKNRMFWAFYDLEKVSCLFKWFNLKNGSGYLYLFIKVFLICIHTDFLTQVWPQLDWWLWCVFVNSLVMCSPGEVRQPKLQLMSFWHFTVKLRYLMLSDDDLHKRSSEVHVMPVCFPE